MTWDAIIIGGGVLGVFHAYFARQRGLRTLLLERDGFPNKASVRNFGMIVPSAMPMGEWLRRAQESTAIYRRVAELLGFSLQTVGTQYLAGTDREAAVLREFDERAPNWGYRCEFCSARESVARNPAIDADYCQASLHFPDDLRFDPRNFPRDLIRWLCENDGLAYLPNTLATRVKTEKRAVAATTAKGEVHRSEHIFVCTGADLRSLFPQRLSAAGLVRCKLQMMRIAPQASAFLPTSLASGLSLRRYPSFQQCPSWPRLMEEPIDPELTRRGIHVLLVQDADGSVVVGDSHEYSPGDFSAKRDARTDMLILETARRMVRLDTWRARDRWSGIYSMHPQADMYTETIDDRIHILTGIGGKGMTAGPALARERIEGAFGKPR